MTHRSIGALIFLVPLYVAAQQDGLIQVKIQSIRVQGSRLPAASIIRLLELRIGQEANEKTVRAALQHANLSGLFSSITFNYESEPGSKDVELILDVHDEKPLLPAAIHVPKVGSGRSLAMAEGCRRAIHSGASANRFGHSIVFQLRHEVSTEQRSQ